MSFVKKPWTKVNWRVGSHGPLNNFVVIVIAIFLVETAFYVVSADRHSPIPFLTLHLN